MTTPTEPNRHNLEPFVLWCKSQNIDPKKGDSLNAYKQQKKMKQLTISIPKPQFYAALETKTLIKNGDWIRGKVLNKKGKTKPFTHLKVKLTSWSSSFYFIAEIKQIDRLEDVQTANLNYEPCFKFTLGVINHFEIPTK